MTGYTKETVEVQRKANRKVCGEFRMVFAKHFKSTCESNLVVDDRFDFLFPGNPDITMGDRCVTEKGVFDVIKTVYNGNGHAMVSCAKNEFETGINKLKDNGCRIEEGIVVPLAKDPEAEVFMDSWVGTYIVNIVNHYDEIRNGRDISSFYGLFNHDVPVVCVGAGPSLDKNIHLLFDFPGIIVVADKAYKMLCARGIDPDFVVSVDCHYDLVSDMLDCPMSKDHKLILNTCSDPKISKVWNGDIFWYNMKHPGVQFMDKILPALFPKFHSLPNLGNVGNSSVFFSDYVGLGPVVLIGQDYGYTGDKMHSMLFDFDKEGNPVEKETDHADLLEKRSGKVRVGDILTYAPFLDYRNTIYDLSEKKGIGIINCTEGGLLTKLQCLPFAEMIEILTPKYRNKYLEAKEKIKKI